MTDQNTDAIVTLIPQNLEYRGSINEALLEASGEQLDEFVLDNIFKPRPGDIYAVPSFNLRSAHIFFNVVPVWRTEFDLQDKFLLNAARKSLELATQMGLSSISIPPMGAGRKAFPKPRAARQIVQGIIDRLNDDIEEVRIICNTEDMLDIFRERLILMGWGG